MFLLHYITYHNIIPCHITLPHQNQYNCSMRVVVVREASNLDQISERCPWYLGHRTEAGSGRTRVSPVVRAMWHTTVDLTWTMTCDIDSWRCTILISLLIPQPVTWKIWKSESPCNKVLFHLEYLELQMRSMRSSTSLWNALLIHDLCRGLDTLDIFLKGFRW